jgi:hypothetical protein
MVMNSRRLMELSPGKCKIQFQGNATIGGGSFACDKKEHLQMTLCANTGRRRYWSAMRLKAEVSYPAAT